MSPGSQEMNPAEPSHPCPQTSPIWDIGHQSPLSQRGLCPHTRHPLETPHSTRSLFWTPCVRYTFTYRKKKTKKTQAIWVWRFRQVLKSYSKIKKMLQSSGLLWLPCKEVSSTTPERDSWQGEMQLPGFTLGKFIHVLGKTQNIVYLLI